MSVGKSHLRSQLALDIVGRSSYSIIGKSRLQMRIALKTYIALITTAFVPMVLFFLIGALSGVADIFSQVFSGSWPANLDDLLINLALDKS